jgi:5,10-methenyltetrahydrofolate synthetase
MNVAEWRKVERSRLLSWRAGLPAAYRAAQTAAICAELDRLIAPLTDLVLGAYWPIRAEPDLRNWLRGRASQGLSIALPVAVAHGQPLSYRRWQPGARMARGLWQIPYPADGPEVAPDLVLAPVVGFDGAGYRLGYGGGFFDRTLAAARMRAIGLGYPGAAVDTIFPQWHDIPMERVVTGRPGS